MGRKAGMVCHTPRSDTADVCHMIGRTPRHFIGSSHRSMSATVDSDAPF